MLSSQTICYDRMQGSARRNRDKELILMQLSDLQLVLSLTLLEIRIPERRTRRILPGVHTPQHDHL